MRLSEFPTYAPLGQFNMPVAMRSNVSGNMEAPATVFWNVKKATLRARFGAPARKRPAEARRGTAYIPPVTNRRTPWPISTPSRRA